ncbi:phosphate ABC transporter substrate-binding protein PstS [Silvanigrella aquatica]|uniref:Phosphate-binding protein n=1 Tax=Silvanigrella aquatica TaxID=1915309 RepID=A0A1L4D0U1_9BACT|nr:phosphate ABC transporter substrate-binding protein PstS [Silvanigrella aquatica]APJ03804.1 phosphate ABC transporter substrate-binding protein PstS [Silvanigrella aquatica]
MMHRLFVSSRVLGASLALTASYSSFASDLITGAGSSFIAPVLYKWSAAYNADKGIKINYQSIGSGAGLKQIEAKIVDFGASDMPLKSEELEQKGLMQFPAIIGGIVPVVNIEGVSHGQLILNAKLIAEIYTGEIKNWNDKRIAELNPTLKLPSKNITVVYRSDSSGTTFNFTHYLEKAGSQVWKAGTGTAVAWPKGIMGVGGKGNEGVTSMVKRASGSIGYVEYAYALQNKLAWTRLQNADGKVVPNIVVADLNNEQKVSEAFRKSFQAASLNAEWEKAPGMYVLLANQKGADTWPITASTFILVHKNQSKPEIGSEVLKFFNYAFTKGAESAQSLDYIPIPEKTYKLIESKWKVDIKSDKDKSPLWTDSKT